MKRWSVFVLAACVVGLGNVALGQRAANYPGRSMGFAPKPERPQKVQVAPVVRPKQDTAPKIKFKKKRVVKRSGNKKNGGKGPSGPYVKMFPQPYDITFKFANEWNATLKSYPKLAFDFAVVTNDRPVIKNSGTVVVGPDGKAKVSCILADPTDQAYITFRLADQTDSTPEWTFADPAKVAYVLPEVYTTAAKRPKPVVREAPPIQLRRNVVDLAMRGLPAGATAKVGSTQLDLKLTSDGLAHFSLPREIAETDQFQVVVRFEDPLIARQAVVDAGLQLLKNGLRVTPYSGNTFNIPDEDWVTERVEFTDLPILTATPTMGLADEVGLYSEQDSVKLLGAPENTEKGLAFTKPDGSEWLHYPTKGISIRARNAGGIGDGKQRGIEVVTLTSPAGGRVGGVAVGDPESLLIERFGAGMTRQRLGGLRVGFRSYFAEGLIFNIDALTKKITSIEIWRPLNLISHALEMVPMAIPNRLFITPQTAIGADSVTGGLGKDLASSLAPMSDWLTTRLGSSKSIRRVTAENEADLSLSWRVVSIKGESSTGVVRGAITIELTMKPRNGNAVVETIESGNVSYNSLTGSNTTELARRVFEKIANPICEKVGNQFSFLNRVRSIDYTSGDIELDFGQADCNLTPGVVFEAMNLKTNAFPEKLGRSDLKTDLGSKEIDSKVGIHVVLVAQTVDAHRAMARFGVLIRQRGAAGQGFTDRVVMLEEKDWRPMLVRLLDPNTGLLFVRLKPVFEVPAEDKSP